MLPHAQDLPIAGLVLISPLLDASGSSDQQGNDQASIFNLPSMAVAAWEHQKIDRGSHTIEQWYEDARQFAQTDYALALQSGASIDPTTRDRIAGKVAAYIGLPQDLIVRAKLRVDSQQFLEQLLAQSDQLVGRLDTRVVAPKPKADAHSDRPPAANDPALGLGASNVIKSDSAKNYFERELKVTTQRDYLALSLDVNFRWNWADAMYARDPKDPEFYINPTPNIAAIMQRRPQLRVLLIGGYYDMAVPLLAPRYALAHAGVPLERVTMVALQAGHSALESDEMLQRGSALLHEFLRAPQ
jgi:carboxypeptidase C (cathepsin A)